MPQAALPVALQAAPQVAPQALTRQAVLVQALIAAPALAAALAAAPVVPQPLLLFLQLPTLKLKLLREPLVLQQQAALIRLLVFLVLQLSG